MNKDHTRNVYQIELEKAEPNFVWHYILASSFSEAIALLLERHQHLDETYVRAIKRVYSDVICKE